ncbi:MAG: hypothetical protein ABF449_14735 [Ethanoligenens sp.]
MSTSNGPPVPVAHSIPDSDGEDVEDAVETAESAELAVDEVGAAAEDVVPAPFWETDAPVEVDVRVPAVPPLLEGAPEFPVEFPPAPPPVEPPPAAGEPPPLEPPPEPPVEPPPVPPAEEETSDLVTVTCMLFSGEDVNSRSEACAVIVALPGETAVIVSTPLAHWTCATDELDELTETDALYVEYPGPMQTHCPFLSAQVFSPQVWGHSAAPQPTVWSELAGEGTAETLFVPPRTRLTLVSLNARLTVPRLK